MTRRGIYCGRELSWLGIKQWSHKLKLRLTEYSFVFDSDSSEDIPEMEFYAIGFTGKSAATIYGSLRLVALQYRVYCAVAVVSGRLPRFRVSDNTAWIIYVICTHSLAVINTSGSVEPQVSFRDRNGSC